MKNGEAINILVELKNEIMDTKIMEALDVAINLLKEKTEYPSELHRIVAEHDAIMRQHEENNRKERIFNPFDHRTIGEI